MYDAHNPLKFSSGISIVEMLVVLVIMTVLVSLGYANFRTFSQRQVLFQAKRQVEGDMSLAREFALQGMKPESGCGILDGYKWKYDSLNGTYGIFADCSVEGLVSVGRDTVSLPDSISMTVDDQSTSEGDPVNDGAIKYKVLGHGTSGGTFTVVLTHDRLGVGTTISQ
jgi:Tfp pilus assembly protein FimT